MLEIGPNLLILLGQVSTKLFAGAVILIYAIRKYMIVLRQTQAEVTKANKDHYIDDTGYTKTDISTSSVKHTDGNSHESLGG